LLEPFGGVCKVSMVIASCIGSTAVPISCGAVVLAKLQECRRGAGAGHTAGGAVARQLVAVFKSSYIEGQEWYMADTRRWFWLGCSCRCAFVWLLHPILTPFLVALLLAYLFDPLVDRLEKPACRGPGAWSRCLPCSP
jgi:hypothetical protein